MSEQLSPKEILKRQKHQHDFTMYQLGFVKYLEDTVDYGNKTFKNFSVDPTQIPCLLMMNIVSHFRRELSEEDYRNLPRKHQCLASRRTLKAYKQVIASKINNGQEHYKQPS